jgi:hypothetical protein
MNTFIHRRVNRTAVYRFGFMAAVGASLCALWLLSAGAKDLVPFKSSLELKVVSSTTDEETGITTQELEGNGIASHMGEVSVWTRIQLEDVGVVEDEDGNLYWASHFWGVEVETAANGDEVSSNIDGLYMVPLPVPTPFLAYIVGTREETGGTGRFLGATGSMTLEGTDSSGVALEAEGQLSSVGSSKN